MSPTIFSGLGVLRARQLLTRERTENPPSRQTWSLPNLAGRLIEISESGSFGSLSFVAGLLAEAQNKKEKIAWIAATPTIFYPPDLAQKGLDVGAITVVWADETKAALQSGEWLLHSGAFGLVVFDWGTRRIEDNFLGRLARWADRHATAVLFLTQKGPQDPALGSLISLRATIAKTASEEVEMTIVKDKQNRGWPRQGMRFYGPSGLH